MTLTVARDDWYNRHVPLIFHQPKSCVTMDMFIQTVAMLSPTVAMHAVCTLNKNVISKLNLY